MLPAIGPCRAPSFLALSCPVPSATAPIPQHWDHGLGPCGWACCALTAEAKERPETVIAASNELRVDIGFSKFSYFTGVRSRPPDAIRVLAARTAFAILAVRASRREVFGVSWSASCSRQDERTSGQSIPTKSPPATVAARPRQVRAAAYVPQSLRPLLAGLSTWHYNKMRTHIRHDVLCHPRCPRWRVRRSPSSGASSPPRRADASAHPACLLVTEPASVGDIAARLTFRVHSLAITLRTLRAARFPRSTRNGKQIIHSPVDDRIRCILERSSVEHVVEAAGRERRRLGRPSDPRARPPLR